VLCRDVGGKLSFSTFAVALKAASAEGSLPVADDPEPSPVVGFLEVEAWPFVQAFALFIFFVAN
jgi:hypothetical protein